MNSQNHAGASTHPQQTRHVRPGCDSDRARHRHHRHSIRSLRCLAAAPAAGARSAKPGAGGPDAAEHRKVATFSIDPTLVNYDGARTWSLQQRLLDEAQTIPGVESAGIAALPLLRGVGIITRIALPDRQPQVTNLNFVTPGYLSALNMTVVAGRTFAAVERGGCRRSGRRRRRVSRACKLDSLAVVQCGVRRSGIDGSSAAHRRRRRGAGGRSGAGSSAASGSGRVIEGAGITSAPLRY